MATVNANAILLVHWSSNVSGNETVSHLSYWKYSYNVAFSFVATVHANATILVHWSNNVSG